MNTFPPLGPSRFCDMVNGWSNDSADVATENNAAANSNLCALRNIPAGPSSLRFDIEAALAAKDNTATVSSGTTEGEKND